MGRINFIAAISFALIAAVVPGCSLAQSWTAEERNVLRSLWIGSLPALPKDLSNRVADNAKAAKLGQKLFFDKRFSGNKKIACSSCHQPEKAFTDGLPQAQGVGRASHHTPTIIGTAYSPWFFWDGRKDSQWSQALGPMENPVEHGGTRTQFAKILYSIPDYRKSYEDIFGNLLDTSDENRFPTIAAPIDATQSRAAWNSMAAVDRQIVSRVYSNIGKAIAAYERLILPGPSRFDQYVEAVLNDNQAAQKRLFNKDEVGGLSLFIGKGNCTQCHNGPLFTNNDFHNTGLALRMDAHSNVGRAAGVKSVWADEFNCLGPFSDAKDSNCGELKFAKLTGSELIGSFKTPTLRNLGKTAPYMHKGQLSTLSEVVDFYNRAPKAKMGYSELRPLRFSEKDLVRLRKFLLTLDGPLIGPQTLMSPIHKE
jgi:cytochrome c peroxidase